MTSRRPPRSLYGITQGVPGTTSSQVSDTRPERPRFGNSARRSTAARSARATRPAAPGFSRETESPRPVAAADDRHRRRARSVFSHRERAAEGRGDAEDVAEARRHARPGRLLLAVAVGGVEPLAGDGHQAAQHAAPRGKDPEGNKGATCLGVEAPARIAWSIWRRLVAQDFRPARPLCAALKGCATYAVASLKGCACVCCGSPEGLRYV